MRKIGHKYPNFRTKDNIPKYDWAIKKAQNHIHSKNDDYKSTIGSTLSSKKEYPVIVWEGLYCSFIREENIRELILLVSDSIGTVFYNPKYVPNIRDSYIPLRINTNGGLIKSHQKCDIPHINNVWYKKLILPIS